MSKLYSALKYIALLAIAGVMNTFVRTGIMSKEEYIAEVKKTRGV